MQLAGKSKVTRLKAKTEIIYPLIRLPKAFADEIGKTAEIYKIENDGCRSLLISFPRSLDSKEVIQPSPKVIQPEHKVIQLFCQNHVEERLLKLESEIKELKSLLLLNEGSHFHRNKNQSISEWARPDSDRRPPPCQDGGFWTFYGLCVRRYDHEEG